MKKLNYKEKGITLVALAITIIILLILAGVALTTALGQNGLFNRAKIAGEEYKKSEADETEKIDEVSNEIDKVIDGMNTDIPTVREAIEKGEKFAAEGNKEIVDEYNNHLTIPQGFHIVMPDDNNGVIYDYTEKGDNIPTVQDGIVIGDSEGNQFVWIPVGTINNNKGSEEKTTEITLGRYTFDAQGHESKPYNRSDLISNNFEETEEEHKKSGLRNTIAKDIEGFETSAKVNHGYYISRYESGNNNGKATSKQGGVWSNATQPTAATPARNMYDSTEFVSDLVNSFAWDTAIVFIQKYSGDTDYSLQRARNYAYSKSSPDYTGERGTTTDKVCNIYDMASNCFEWTTESCKDSTKPYVQYGGGFNNNNSFCVASHRGSYESIRWWWR